MAAIPVAAAAPYGPGTTTNPQGQELTADQRSFFLNGKPWIPVTGEFHYARYPRADWRDELLKMKAGGINAVSSYVFWIHHEEVQGTFDGSDNRSLHDFIKLCQDLDLKVFLRMGPYSMAKPAPKSVASPLTRDLNGIFTRLTPSALNDPEPVEITASLSKPAGPAATTLNGTDEKTWDDAAVYDLQIPSTAQGRRLLLDIHYIGDAARLYIGDKLYDDNFFNGDPFSVALWRIPADQWPNLKLKVLPYSDGLLGRLPKEGRDAVDQAKSHSTLDPITIVAKDQLELRITSP